MDQDRLTLCRAATEGHVYWAVLIGCGDGCDYCIDCNITVKPLESNNLEEANEELITLCTEYYQWHSIEAAFVIEAKSISLLNMSDLYSKAEKRKEEVEKTKTEKEEKELLKKLQKKYGK